MKIQELRQFTRNSLHGNYRTAWRIVLLYLIFWAVMKTVPDILAGILLHKNIMTSGALFFGREKFWILFAVLWDMLCFCIFTPLLCSGFSWFSSLLGFGEKNMHPFRNRYVFWHSLRFFGVIEMIKFFMIMPFVISCMLTVFIFQNSISQEDAGLWLFLAVQGVAVSVWIMIYNIKFYVRLLATPLLFLEKPDSSVFRMIGLSGKLLNGQYGKLFLILLSDFCLPKQIAMFVLFLQIRIREYLQEQEWNQEEVYARFAVSDEQGRALHG